MSSILMVKNGKFIVMGGDKQRTSDGGEVTRNDINKVFKIKENLLIGLAGLGELTDFTKETIKIYFKDREITKDEVEKLILHLKSKISEKIIDLKAKYSREKDLEKIEKEGVSIYIGFKDESTSSYNLEELTYKKGEFSQNLDIVGPYGITKGMDIAQNHLDEIKDELNITNSKKWIKESLEKISRDPKNNTGSTCDILTI